MEAKYYRNRRERYIENLLGIILYDRGGGGGSNVNGYWRVLWRMIINTYGIRHFQHAMTTSYQ